MNISMRNFVKVTNQGHLGLLSGLFLKFLVYINEAMNEEQKHQFAKDVIASEMKKRLYLYSYIALIVLAFLAILFAAISLVVDAQLSSNQQPSMACSYVALSFSGLGLIFIAILSALYFVDPSESATPSRIKAVSFFRVAIRFCNLASGLTMMVSSFVGLAGGSEKGWNSFIKGWGIALLVIEGLMFLYELWKLAWIKENPERYLTPVYPVAKRSAAEPAKKATSTKPLEKKDDVIEVEEAHPAPKEIPQKKNDKK
jgi:hypothetical protein